MPPLVLALLASLLLAPLPAKAQHVFLPSSDVGLVPLPGMVPAQGFSGFMGPGPTAVMITTTGDGPADPAAVTAHMAQRMAEGGFRQTARREIKVAGTTAQVWEGTSRVERNGQAMTVLAIGMVLVTGDRVVGVWVTTPLADATAEKRAAIEAMLLSVVVRPADPIGARAALPFRFDETDRLRVNRLLSGMVAILAPPGAGDTGAESAHLPRMVIALEPNPIDPTAGTLEAHARAVVDQIAAAADRDRSKDLIRRDQVAGGPAVAWLLTATDGTRMALWVAFMRDHRMLTALAWAPEDQFEAILPEFRAVVRSIRLR